MFNDDDEYTARENCEAESIYWDDNCIENIRDELDSLSNEQRIEIISGYCIHCGAKIPPECFCMRDD